MNKSRASESSSSASLVYLHAALSEESRRATDASSLSREVAAFIAEEIGSVEQLEILLHLFRNSDRWWSAAEVYEVVKSSLGSVQDRLKRFTDHGVVEKNRDNPPRYRYNTVHKQRLPVVAELDEQYRERRVRVVEFIYSQVSSGVSEFARAFRIRKESD